jgi:hypothetical protein
MATRLASSQLQAVFRPAARMRDLRKSCSQVACQHSTLGVPFIPSYVPHAAFTLWRALISLVNMCCDRIAHLAVVDASKEESTSRC